MEHQFLHLIIAPLVKQPKCELTPIEHSMDMTYSLLQREVPRENLEYLCLRSPHSQVTYLGLRQGAYTRGNNRVNNKSFQPSLMFDGKAKSLP
jgi:hypothetical protein